MQRKSLIVAGAGGPEDIVEGILARFGFGPPTQTTDMAHALAYLRDDHFDLVIVPIHDVEPLQLAALEREIRRGKFTCVIGTGPKADPELLLRAMRSGIQEFLVFPPEPKDLTGAVDRLMRRHRAETQRGQIVAIHSAKGGLGNTSIAVNLAYGFAKNHPEARVALADLVVAGGDVRVLLNLKPAYDMGDLVRKLDRVDADLLYSLLTPCPGGVWALPGPDTAELNEVLDASTVTTLVEHLRAHFAYTVLDCEHHLSERTLAAMDVSDRIVLVTQLTVPALRSTQRSLALARRLGYPEDKICVVVNRYQSGEVLSLADAKTVLKCDVFWKLPNDYRLSATALDRGAPVIEVDPAAKLSWSYVQLSAKIGGSADSADRANGRLDTSRLRQFFGMGKGGGGSSGVKGGGA